MTASQATTILRLRLPDEGATLELGRALSSVVLGVVDGGQPPALLLQGGLGSGKTTLVRGLAQALPGGGEAEVSSPSFNIVNLYPTRPPVAHFDLYRVAGPMAGQAPEEFLDAAEDGRTLVVAEWIEHLANDLWPKEALHLRWVPASTGRAIEIRALGSAAGALLALLASRTPQWHAAQEDAAKGEER